MSPEAAMIYAFIVGAMLGSAITLLVSARMMRKAAREMRLAREEMHRMLQAMAAGRPYIPQPRPMA